MRLSIIAFFFALPTASYAADGAAAADPPTRTIRCRKVGQPCDYSFDRCCRGLSCETVTSIPLTNIPVDLKVWSYGAFTLIHVGC